MKDGKIKRKVKPGQYVWMVKGRHGTQVHPDDVKDKEFAGYKQAPKPVKK